MKKHVLAAWCITGALFAGVVCGVTAYLVPHIPLIWQVSAGFAVVLFLAYLVLDYRSIGRLFSKKTTLYGLNALVMVIVVIGITVFLNLIANNHDIKHDFTKNKLNTLSDQTIQVLKALKSDVVVKAFVHPNLKDQYNEVFKRYTYFSKNFKPEFADLDREPHLVKEYKIRQGGGLIFESAGRQERVDEMQAPDDDPKLEEKLTNAIIRVTRAGKKKVYFVSGHGEHSINDREAQGMSQAKEALDQGGFEAAEIILAQKDKVPEDAALVVINGSKSNFVEHELKILEDYLLAGGHVFVGLDPDSSLNLKPFLAKFGVDWKAGKAVVETNPLQQIVGSPLIPVVTAFDPSHQVSKAMRGMTIHEISTPVEKMAHVPEGYKVTTLSSTSQVSLEVDFAKKIKADPKKDRKGPLGVALAIEAPIKKKDAPPAKPELVDPKKDEAKEEKTPELRLIVVGDSDFAANGGYRTALNADFFQNSLSWLAEEEDLIAIRPKPKDERQFDVTENRAKIIRVASLIFLPLWFVVLGVVVWRSRKNK